VPTEVKPSERNAGKRWSTRDKRDLAETLARGESLEAAAGYLLRPISEAARMAAELGLLTGAGGRFHVIIYKQGGERAGIEMELARDDRLDEARLLYRLMCGQYPGRLVMLCNKAQILARSDRAETMPR